MAGDFYGKKIKSLKSCVQGVNPLDRIGRQYQINKWKLVKSSDTWLEIRSFHLLPYISRFPSNQSSQLQSLDRSKRWRRDKLLTTRDNTRFDLEFEGIKYQIIENWIRVFISCCGIDFIFHPLWTCNELFPVFVHREGHRCMLTKLFNNQPKKLCHIVYRRIE